jgi:predicted amidophosphoribosyltransferase
MLLLLIGAPTLWLWRRDRRREPGHCQRCNYDLTGNTGGVCPECGSLVQRVIASEQAHTPSG